MAPEVWFALAVGELDWDRAVTDGQIHASGTRAEIKDHLPLL
jgi:hypothetical protein